MAKLVFLILSFSLATVAQSRQVDRIDITSAWGGLGKPQSSKLAIVRKGNGYVANGKKIDLAKINALIRALDEPDIEEPSLDNIGITQAWLVESARKCLTDCVNGYIYRANPDQQQLFFTKYTDLQFAQERLKGLFSGGWTDDHPRFEVNIKYSDGSVLKIFSGSQVLFMIPWQIEDGTKDRTTFNAHISNALVSILPSKFTNASRLGGNSLAESLARSVLGATQAEWKRLEVINRVKEAVAIFEKDYEIVSMELNSNHDSDFGTPWNSKNPREENLHLLLRKRDFADGFALKLILPVEKDKVQNIEIFKRDIESYLNLMRSVPWLKEFVDTSSNHVWLRFVKNRSLSEKGMQTFAEDMKALGKADLANEVQKVQDQVVLLSIGGGLEYYQSFWLILPDGRSVVWRHYYVSPLPQLTFTGRACAQARSNSTPCVGALISREGRIIEN